MKKGSRRVGRFFIHPDNWVFGKHGIVSCWSTPSGFVVAHQVNPGDEDGAQKFETETEAITFARL